MTPHKSIFALALLICLVSTKMNAQANFRWGLYTQLSQGNISDIYEWRNFLCFEACSSEGHKSAFSYEVGLLGQLSMGKKMNVQASLGYSRFNYIEEESWSDGAGFYIRDTKRQLQHLTLGLGLQYNVMSWGSTQKQVYISGGIQGMWNAKQEVDFGMINFEGTIAEWNSMAEFGIGVKGMLGKTQWQAGPYFRLALNNFAKPLAESTRITSFDQLSPRELGIKLAVLFP